LNYIITIFFILCTEILQEYHDNIFPGYENVLKNMTGFLSQIKIEKALFIFYNMCDINVLSLMLTCDKCWAQEIQHFHNIVTIQYQGTKHILKTKMATSRFADLSEDEMEEI
jgi:hypothetical protein